MKVTIVATSKSITITDADNNKVSILKGENGLEAHSSFTSTKGANVMMDIQKKIKNIILNPGNNRDNYKVRFDRLSKHLTGANVRTFLTVKNALESAMV